jgi:hypothetical protein
MDEFVILPESYTGKRVLIGMTYLDYDETLIKQEQFHGIILRVDDDAIAVKLADSGEEFTLPPDLTALEVARKGEYRLHPSNEIVVDPDFLVTWTMIKARPEDSVH